LEACVAELVVLAPNAARTVTYQWTLAVQKGDSVAAAKLVERARQVGMQPAGVERMADATKSARGRAQYEVLAALIAAGALLFGGIFLYGRGSSGKGPRVPTHKLVT
jgi:hypothetical protein